VLRSIWLDQYGDIKAIHKYVGKYYGAARVSSTTVERCIIRYCNQLDTSRSLTCLKSFIAPPTNKAQGNFSTWTQCSIVHLTQAYWETNQSIGPESTEPTGCGTRRRESWCLIGTFGKQTLISDE
jgi:hypothetical protein